MPGLYVIEGDDDCQKKDLLHDLSAQKTGLEPYQISKQTKLEEWLNLFNASGLFSQAFFYYSYQPDWLKTSWNAADIKTSLSLEDTLNTMPHSSVILLDKRLDVRTKSGKWLKKHAKVLSANAFKPWEQQKVIQWLKQYAQKHQILIEDSALNLLVEQLGTHLMSLVNQLKLLNCLAKQAKPITTCEILELYAVENCSTLSIAEHLAKGQLIPIIKQIKVLLKNGEDPIKLFGFFTHQLLVFQWLFMPEKLSVDKVAKTLGKHPFIIKKLKPQVQKWLNPRLLSKMICCLAEYDSKLKKGDILAKDALLCSLYTWIHYKNSMQIL